MQVIAEGATVLKHSQFELDLAEVFREASVSAVIWQDDEWRVYRVEK